MTPLVWFECLWETLTRGQTQTLSGTTHRWIFDSVRWALRSVRPGFEALPVARSQATTSGVGFDGIQQRRWKSVPPGTCHRSWSCDHKTFVRQPPGSAFGFAPKNLSPSGGGSGRSLHLEPREVESAQAGEATRGSYRFRATAAHRNFRRWRHCWQDSSVVFQRDRVRCDVHFRLVLDRRNRCALPRRELAAKLGATGLTRTVVLAGYLGLTPRAMQCTHR